MSNPKVITYGAYTVCQCGSSWVTDSPHAEGIKTDHMKTTHAEWQKQIAELLQENSFGGLVTEENRMPEFTKDQLVLACGDAARAGAESERASITRDLEKLLGYAQTIKVNQLTIEGISMALDKVKNV